ncbi:hypothetical protein AAC387_Pa09g1351 [Persea americana]
MEDGLLLKERIVVVEEEGERSLRWSAIWEEVKKLGVLAGPMVAVTVSQYLLQVISLMIVGHLGLGETSLSSAALATSLTVVTGFSLLCQPPLLLTRYMHSDKSNHPHNVPLGGWMMPSS